MAFPANPLLDLTVPLVGESFRFDLLDRDRNRIGTLAALEDSTVSIEHNVDRSVKRTMSGLKLSPRETLAVDPLSDRVQPVMTLADDTEWPLGVFVFTDYAGKRDSTGLTADASLQDGGALLEQGIPRTISLAPGSSVRAAVIAYLEEAGILAYEVDPFDNVVGRSPKVWKPLTPWRQVLQDLLGPSGLASASFNNAGVCRIQEAPPADDAAEVDTDYRVGPEGRIHDGSVVEADNTLDAPNRYVALDPTASAAPIVGVYDIPDTAPHSVANRGYAITTQVEVQGLDTVEEAVAAARAAYLRSRHMASVSFTTPPDPRHDLWNVIGYAGVPWRERRWTMSCKPGGAMAHEARRTFT